MTQGSCRKGSGVMLVLVKEGTQMPTALYGGIKDSAMSVLCTDGGVYFSSKGGDCSVSVYEVNWKGEGC